MTEERGLTLRDSMELGDVFFKSGMFSDLKSAAQAVVKIQAGAELGIPPFAAMSGIHVIQGKPALGAGLIAGRIKGSGKYDYRVARLDDTGCVVEFYQGGDKIGESAFTQDDAKKAGLAGKDMWAKFPRNMFFARALANGARWYCPDVFAGSIYTPEELGSDAIDADYHVVESRPSPQPVKVAQLPPQPEPTPIKPHWIDDADTRKKFWAWARTDMSLADADVYAALRVGHIHDYAGTRTDAFAAIRDYVDHAAQPDDHANQSS